MSDKTYVIKEETLTGIADAVRGMRYEKGELTPAEIEAKIRASHLGIPISVSNHTGPDGKWQRPAEYPDLDSIEIPDDFDGVYLTYDLRKTPGYGWIGVYVQNATNNTPFWVERGHLENGAFVADEVHECVSSSSSAATSTRFFRQYLDETYGNVQLWRVHSESHMVWLAFATNEDTSAQCFPNSLQPCVEAVGNLPYINNLSSNPMNTNATYTSWGTIWLERDARVVGKLANVSTLQSCWGWCISLQELDLSKWDVSNWHISSLRYAWQYCRSLQSLDFSGWDTSNWPVSGIHNMFESCLCLRSLDLSYWDTSKWTISSLVNVWSGCQSLVSLNISNWDTSDWEVTTLSATWNQCISLQELDVSNWNTSNWAVTTLASTWSNCWALRSIDLSKWDVSNWAVTTLASTWNCNYGLELLKVDTWDTSKWEVTSIEAMFANCREMTSYDFLQNWDTSNWAVKNMYATFKSNFTCKEIDIHAWNTDKWDVTDTRYCFTELFLIEKLLLPEGISVNSSNGNQSPSDSRLLREYNGYEMFYNHTYVYCYSLSHASLISILNKLGTVTAARTITLGQTNRLKLTEAEIAIATQKGWTVA